MIQITKQSQKGYVPTKTADLSKFPRIKGYDLKNQKFDFNRFIEAYSTTGIQASKLSHAIETIKTMRRENAEIFLSYTSNMVSSGVRETIRYLVENKEVSVLICCAGGIEEDFLKTFGDFALGDFNVSGKLLNDQGINRIGNIFVTNDFYAKFEIEMHKILDVCYNKSKKEGRPLCTSEMIYEMGKFMDEQNVENKETSIIYWAYKNKIPIFSPAFTDGSIGDMIYFHRQKKKDFYVDISQDMDKIIKIALNAEKTGVISLGGGSSKHYALNAQIFREGADFAVFINTHPEFDASDSGADCSEAVSWSKIKANAPQVKVYGDASILFPLIIAAIFKDIK